MKKFNLFFLISVLLGLPCFSAIEKPPTETNCQSAQEFITSLRYFRDKKLLPENQAREKAMIVATGCTSAAQRLIKVIETLSIAGQPQKDALNTGIEYSLKSDQETEAFVHIFQTAFSSDELDLDFAASIKMANELSASFSGNIVSARDDFDGVFKYCRGHWFKSARECVALAIRVAKKGVPYGGGIAPQFIKLSDFLKSCSGSDSSLHDAITKAEEIAVLGLGATDNYIQAYKFSTSKDGMSLSHADAMAYAMKLALLTKRP